MSVKQDLYVRGITNLAGVVTALDDVNISGNLTVTGTTTSIGGENVLIADNYQLLNSQYTSDTALTGGIVVNYDPTTVTASGTTGGVATTTSISVGDSSVFATDDLILVTGASNSSNNGIYEVDSITDGSPDTIVIRGAANTNFAQTAFVVDTGDTGYTVTKVNVAVLFTKSTGVWTTTFGSTATAINGSNEKEILLAGGASSNTSLTLTAASNQLTMLNTTISAPGSTTLTYTIPDVGVAADFVMTEGNQTIGGTKTFDGGVATTSSLVVENSVTQTSGNLMAINGDAGQTALNVTAGNVIFADNLSVTSGTTSLDPNSVTGGALTISNTADQTSGELVSIQGTSGTTALAVTNGFVSLDPSWPAGGALTINSSVTQTSGNLVTIIGDSGQTAMQVTSGDVRVGGGGDLYVQGGGTTLDPISASGGALTITNATAQTSGSLVSITGDATYTALNVSAGNVVIADNLDVTSGTTTLDSNDASTSSLIVQNTTTQTSGNLMAINGDSGQTALNVTAGNVIVADNTDISGLMTVNNVVEGVKPYSGAGPHVLGTDGQRVNIVTHTTSSSVTLPDSPTGGLVYTIIQKSEDDNVLTINRSGSNTIENDSLTSFTLDKKHQRVTMQYVDSVWYIV